MATLPLPRRSSFVNGSIEGDLQKVNDYKLNIKKKKYANFKGKVTT